MADTTGTPVWTPIDIVPGTPVANNNNQTVDVAFIESSGNLAAIFANADYPLKEFLIGEATIHAISGTNIPTARSVCISAGRVIALKGQHTVVWSNINNRTVFDSNAIVSSITICIIFCTVQRTQYSPR
jgi:hypothetical protein